MKCLRVEPKKNLVLKNLKRCLHLDRRETGPEPEGIFWSIIQPGLSRNMRGTSTYFGASWVTLCMMMLIAMVEIYVNREQHESYHDDWEVKASQKEHENYVEDEVH